MKKIISILTVSLGLIAQAEGEYNLEAAVQNSIQDVVVRQLWPWSTDVVATFHVAGLAWSNAVNVALSASVGGTPVEIPAAAVRDSLAYFPNGEYTLRIDPTQIPALVEKKSVTDFRVALTPSSASEEKIYMIVDLVNAGTVQYLTRGDILSGEFGTFETNLTWITGSTVADARDSLIWTGVTNDIAYATTKMVFRKIPAGTFMMSTNEFAHQVTLSKDYWMGVFEVTQKQYELIYGSLPAINSEFTEARKGDVRSMIDVNQSSIRGNFNYHQSSTESSFLGKLKAHVGSDLLFDLPTEAQWEYACRAGTTTDFNNGQNAASAEEFVSYGIGRVTTNINDGRGGYTDATRVGSYLANAWGLYDMHGNVSEWCLGWYADFTENMEPVTDPTGPETGEYGILRGGSFLSTVAYNKSTSSYRSSETMCSRAPAESLGTWGMRSVGFRVSIQPPAVAE